MIQQFVDRFMAAKPKLQAQFSTKIPETYEDIVKSVVEVISDEDDREQPDPTRIHAIDDGDYQGTRVFVIGENGYQPSKYWFVYVSYGSCSGCDSLQAIQSDYRWSEDDDKDRPVKPELVEQLMTMALHIVQEMKEMAQ